MKTFTTSSLLVNRLLNFSFTLIFFISGTTAFANCHQESDDINTTITSGIEYASLVASATEKNVFIDWVTSSEDNNSHFEVESSLDMKEFKTVAIVLDGFTAVGTGKSYKFKEDAGEVRKGRTVYYRLKQIDNNGNVSYSPILKVQLNKHYSPTIIKNDLDS